MSLTLLRDVVADGLLFVVLVFLYWGMGESTAALNVGLAVATVAAVRFLRPRLGPLGVQVRLRLNQWLEWPFWRRIASVHEAGHVIVAHRLGVGVRGYALTPAASAQHQTSGHVLLAETPFSTNPEQLIAGLSVLVAGKVAEEAVLGCARGATHDLRRLQEWAVTVDACLTAQERPPVGAGFWQTLCEERARRLLIGNEALIERVAAAMLRCESIEHILAQIDGEFTS